MEVVLLASLAQPAKGRPISSRGKSGKYSSPFYCGMTTISCGTRFYTYAKADYSVSDCLFQSLSASSDGGAIYIESGNCTLVILRSIFAKCSSNGSGGAIDYSYGDIKISKTCVSECSCGSNSDGAMLYIYASSGSTYQAILNQTTTIECNPYTLPNASGSAISSQAGTHTYRYLNLSRGCSTDNSCLVFKHSATLIRCSNLIIANCTSQYATIYEYGSLGSAFSEMNFVSNIITSSTLGLIAIQTVLSNSNFTGCVLRNNSGGALFCAIGNQAIYVEDCEISKASEIGTGNVQTIDCNTKNVEDIEFTVSYMTIAWNRCGVIDPDSVEEEKLSGGAIAGITIGCVAAVAGAAAGVFFYLRKRRLTHDMAMIP